MCAPKYLKNFLYFWFIARLYTPSVLHIFFALANKNFYNVIIIVIWPQVSSFDLTLLTICTHTHIVLYTIYNSTTVKNVISTALYF